MMYLVHVVPFKVTCDPERIIQNAVKKFHMVFIDGSNAVDQLVDAIDRLVRVCNRNKRGAKMNLGWKKSTGILNVYAGKDEYECSNIVTIWFQSVEKKVVSIIDVDCMVEECVHNDNLIIFDQYLAEKKGGES